MQHAVAKGIGPDPTDDGENSSHCLRGQALLEQLRLNNSMSLLLMSTIRLLPNFFSTCTALLAWLGVEWQKMTRPKPSPTSSALPDSSTCSTMPSRARSSGKPSVPRPPAILVAGVRLAHDLIEGEGYPAMDKQLAGLSILITIVWISAVLLVMYWISS